MFVSTGAKNSGLEISGVLAFPRGAHRTEERATVPQTPRKGDAGRQRRATAAQLSERPGDEVLDDRRPTDGPAEEAFPPIPNEIWGSDHLALGVEVVLLKD